jgi:histidyl-tRNA synthetase
MTNKTQKILESAIIAKHFGFDIVNPHSVTKDDIKTTKDAQKEVGYLDDNLFPMEEAISILRNYKEEIGKESIEPALMYFEGSAPGSHKKRRKKPGEELINMHIVNVEKSIADATMIKAAQVMLQQSGIKDICVRINNIGGKDSQAAFLREATNYYRKNINDMTVNCRQYFKDGIHTLIKKGKNQCSIVHENAPRTMDFLGEETRKHFSEVIEFLETLNIPYEIDQFLTGDQNYSSHTVFEIIDVKSGKVVAAGSRYNLLYKKIGTRKEIPSIGMVVNLPKQKTVTKISLKKVEDSKIFFLQIGYAAKLNSLRIIDDLRKENIPVKHKLYRDRLTNQISASKKAKSEYLIITGQKEAMEGTIIFRDKESKSQLVIDLNDLPKTLKAFK